MDSEMGPGGQDGLSIRETFLHECEAMIRYASGLGRPIPGHLVQDLITIAESASLGEKKPPSEGQGPGAGIATLVSIHGELAKIVAPATPRTIQLLQRGSERRLWSRLGPVSLIQQMMGMALLSLAVFMGLYILQGVLEAQGYAVRGWLQIVLDVPAAALGASFLALFQAHRHIQSGTFDDTYDSSYWIRFVLGLLSGIMLAELLPLENTTQITKSTFAMLGGFSTAVVHRILLRLVDVVESLFRGDPRELTAAQESAAAARFAEESAQTRVKLLSRLADLKQQVSSESPPKEIGERIDEMIRELMPREI